MSQYRRVVMAGMLAATAVIGACGGAGAAQPEAQGGMVYQNAVYKPPAERPFISLAQYTAAGPRSAAASRLKEQVDDVVTVTRGLGSSATYDKLVEALNANHYGYSPVDAVVLFKLTGNSAYIDQAIRMVDLLVSSETGLILAGSTPRIASDSYLNVGAELASVALAYDYGFSRLTGAQRKAWSDYADQALFNVWNPEKARWGSSNRPWTGWSINDPGNNYHYSFLMATELWALASQNDAWIAFLRTQKFPQLVRFFGVLDSGGSREGTGYGTAIGSLFEDYAYWKDSTGEDLSAYSSHARNTIDYWIHATVPTFEYFAPIGDQARSSMPVMFDYQRKLMLEAVALGAGSDQASRGLWWLQHARLTDGGTGWTQGRMNYNFDFRYDLLAAGGAGKAPISLSYDAAGTGAMFARSDWNGTASWMHANVGHYEQSHAHQDQGSFSFFRGEWLTVSSNVHSHSGIEQGTDTENVLRFDSAAGPVPQNNSNPARSMTDTGDAVQIDADLSPAYSSSGQKVQLWRRQFSYQRSTHTLAIHDLCRVRAGVTPVFQLHLPVAPVRQKDGSYVAGALRIVVQQPTDASLTVVSMKELSAEFNDGYRLELRGPVDQCEFTVALTALAHR
jgi:hypothetical protein